jgi:hypothetical protein
MERQFTELTDTELDEVFGGHFATICSCSGTRTADSCLVCNAN